MRTISPLRGQIWWADLDPAVGHEQGGGRRPVLIFSNDRFLQAHYGLVTIVPVTTVERDFPTRVRIEPPEANLRRVSFVVGEQVRTVSHQRLFRAIGSVEPATLLLVEHVVRRLLDL